MIFKRAISIEHFLKIAVDFNTSLEDSIKENFQSQKTIKDLKSLTNEVLELYDAQSESYKKPLEEFNYENIQAFVIDKIFEKYELAGPLEDFEAVDIERIKNNPELLKAMITESLQMIMDPKRDSDFVCLLVGDIIDLYRGSQRYQESFDITDQSYLA